mmetsp:Transcript_28096/g.90100  ORF Transcript_28096/g.90100 Transcript_28096/m.90100 type:complete len:204 (+) Transcript_28096:483-1094(+)
MRALRAGIRASGARRAAEQEASSTCAIPQAAGNITTSACSGAKRRALWRWPSGAGGSDRTRRRGAARAAAAAAAARGRAACPSRAYPALCWGYFPKARVGSSSRAWRRLRAGGSGGAQPPPAGRSSAPPSSGGARRRRRRPPQRGARCGSGRAGAALRAQRGPSGKARAAATWRRRTTRRRRWRRRRPRRRTRCRRRCRTSKR